MKYEQLAVVNQQLAGMLKAGIPLEGALKQLCSNMQAGLFRSELEALEVDLAGGTPLEKALGARQLPEFYTRMLKLGVRSNDFVGVVTMLADYYQRAGLVWTRLQGLMVYPAIVLVLSLILSSLAAFFGSRLVVELAGGMDSGWAANSIGSKVGIAWIPAGILLIFILVFASAVIIPACRRRLRWWAPGFREESLTNFATTMHLMLRSGSHLGDALGLAERLEEGTPAGKELRQWSQRLREGHSKIWEFGESSKVFPPLFLWLIAQGGEDLAAGFKRAADIYHARGLYRVEMLLYAALPVSVVVLGALIVGQFLPVVRVLTTLVDSLGNAGGD